jgi:hypothetical protein
MVTSRELMVGNYIRKHDGRIIQVDEQDLVFIKRGIGTSYDPVSLNLEILESCGFSEDKAWLTTKKGWRYFNNENVWIRTSTFGFTIVVPVNLYYMDVSTEIKYLHQLQNLFFALKGKELEVKMNYSPA